MAKLIEFEFQFRNKRFKDAEKGLRAFANELQKDGERLGGVAAKELLFFLDGVAEAMIQRHGTPWPSGTTPNTMARRSGNTMRAVADSVRVQGSKLSDVQGMIGGPVYLRIHEYGGTIRPKRAKYLAIPLPEALDSRGVPKRRGPRDWKNTFVAKSKKGNLLIFQKRGKDIVPLYALKSEVRIPARLGMKKTLEAGLPYFVDRAMDKMLAQLLGRN